MISIGSGIDPQRLGHSAPNRDNPDLVTPRLTSNIAKLSPLSDVTLSMFLVLALAAATPPPAQAVAHVSATIVSGIAVRGPRAVGRDLPRVLVTRERRCEPPLACRLIVTDLP